MGKKTPTLPRALAQQQDHRRALAARAVAAPVAPVVRSD